MKKTFFFILFILSAIAVILFVRPSNAFAQCSGPACVWVSCTKCDTVCNNPPYCTDTFQNCYPSLCCRIPQSGGGSCTCCQDNSCIFGCSTTDGGGDGGSGSTPTFTPTPVPAGTARVRAYQVPTSTTSCSQITSGTPIAVDMSLVGPVTSSTKTTNTDGTWVSWSSLPVGTYGLDDAPPAGYVPKLACWTSTVPAANGTGFQADIGDGGTTSWNVAYTAGAPWSRIRGGDVYAAGRVQSYIPSTIAVRTFVTDGTGGKPGIVTYGSSYDFDGSSGSLLGESYVSSTDWLVNETFPSTDYYAVMYHRFGNPTPTASGNISLSNRLSGSTIEGDANVYYYDGNVSIDTNAWTIPSNESVVVFVSGNLTINQPLNITSGGFLAFIVKGDITVSSTVGVAYTSATPSIQGVYITSPSGTFHTGVSTTAAARRLVSQGTFIAGTFDLQRDLDADSANDTLPAELFIYDPSLLVNMPEKMQDIPVTWQEVAP